MNIHQPAEDYLDQIHILLESKGYARSVDIADALNVKKPSVSVAMKKLRENGYITMEKNGELTLLPPGRAIAEKIYERHKVLTDFFQSLGVDEETAAKDACKVEHDLSEVTFEKLKNYITNKEDN